MGTALFGTLLLYFAAPALLFVVLWAGLLYVALFWWLLRLPLVLARAAWRAVAASSGSAAPHPSRRP